jgi:archaellum component FlaF (FlaF/FlaG flagellin family)
MLAAFIFVIFLILLGIFYWDWRQQVKDKETAERNLGDTVSELEKTVAEREAIKKEAEVAVSSLKVKISKDAERLAAVAKGGIPVDKVAVESDQSPAKKKTAKKKK